MLGPGSGTILEYMMGIDGWSQPGTYLSPPRKISSFVRSDSRMTNGSTNEVEMLTSEDFFFNESMLPLLRNWELTETILNVYTSTLSEILSNCNPTISGCGDHDKEVNKFIKDIGLTSDILLNLKDDLYFGQRAFLIDYKNTKIYDLKDSRNVVLIKKNGNVYRYADSMEAITEKLDKSKLYSSSKIGFIGFNLRKVAGRCTGRLENIDEVFKDKVEDITYFRGKSALASGMYLIFEHMLKSLLRLLLTLKNTTRPDLIQVQINKDKTSEVNITEAVSAIESLLNQGEYAFDLRSNNIMNIVQTLYNSVINSVKVLPVISNINSLDVLQQPPIGDRIDKLTQEINDAKMAALMNLAIPEDIIGTGSNKWEILSRSTRFNTRMNDLLTQIGNTYKLVAFNYFKNRDIKINLDQIDINIDSSSYLTDSNFSGRTTLLSEKLSKMREILSACQELEDLQMINKFRMRKFIRDNLISTDKDLAELLKTEEEIRKSIEDNDQSSGDSGGSGGDLGGGNDLGGTGGSENEASGGADMKGMGL